MRDNLLSIGTVAGLVGRSRVTLLNLERDGLIPPPLRVEGRDWRLFRREDLPAIEAAIANRRGPGRPPRHEADDGPEAA